MLDLRSRSALKSEMPVTPERAGVAPQRSVSFLKRNKSTIGCHPSSPTMPMLFRRFQRLPFSR